MTNFICVEGTDYGANEFTRGSGGEFVSREDMYANTTSPMCWAGFFKPQWSEICQQHNLTFYNFDSAYFGNVKRKIIFRLSVNDFQNTSAIVPRSSDRWEKLKITPLSFQQGSSIVVVPPDRKKMNALGLGTVEEWVETCCIEIKKYTDRSIRIRTRPEPRADRLKSNTFFDFIKNDTFCVVGHSSNALVEAAMCDIPTISLGHSAVKSLYNYSLQDIEKIKPAYLSDKQAWLNHLAYSQFTREELLSGLAWELIN